MITVKMPVKVTFDATLSVVPPVAYIIPKNVMPDSVLHRLRLHGVVVEEAKAPATLDGVQVFSIDSMIKRGNPFQGHSEVRLDGTWRAESPASALGDIYVVRTTQPLGVLVVELLEAQSDDGLVTWNFFDGVLDAAMKNPTGQRTFPVLRATKPIAFPTRIIQ